jgi:hypothetical protein
MRGHFRPFNPKNTSHFRDKRALLNAITGDDLARIEAREGFDRRKAWC